MAQGEEIGSATLLLLGLRAQQEAGLPKTVFFQQSPGGASASQDHPSHLFPEEPVNMSMVSAAKFGWALGPTDRFQGSGQTQERLCELWNRPEMYRGPPG